MRRMIGADPVTQRHLSARACRWARPRQGQSNAKARLPEPAAWGGRAGRAAARLMQLTDGEEAAGADGAQQAARGAERAVAAPQSAARGQQRRGRCLRAILEPHDVGIDVWQAADRRDLLGRRVPAPTRAAQWVSEGTRERAAAGDARRAGGGLGLVDDHDRHGAPSRHGLEVPLQRARAAAGPGRARRDPHAHHVRLRISARSAQG